MARCLCQDEAHDVSVEVVGSVRKIYLLMLFQTGHRRKVHRAQLTNASERPTINPCMARCTNRRVLKGRTVIHTTLSSLHAGRCREVYAHGQGKPCTSCPQHGSSLQRAFAGGTELVCCCHGCFSMPLTHARACTSSQVLQALTCLQLCTLSCSMLLRLCCEPHLTGQRRTMPKCQP